MQSEAAAAIHAALNAAALEAALWSGAGSPGALSDSLRELANRLREAGMEPDAGELEDLRVSLAQDVGNGDRLFDSVTACLARLQQKAAGGVVEPSGPAAEETADSDLVAALNQDPEFLKDVVVESKDHLASIEEGLLKLEQNPSDTEAIASVFRGFHSVKGLMAFLGVQIVQEAAHEAESLLDLIRNGKLGITQPVVDAILAAGDYLRGATASLESVLNGAKTVALADNAPLIRRIVAAAEGGEAPAQPLQPPPPAPEMEFEPEPVAASPAPAELKPAAPAAKQPKAAAPAKPKPAAPAPAPAPAAAGGAAEQKQAAGEVSTVKVDAGKLEYLMDMVGELVIAQSMVRQDPTLGSLNAPSLTKNLSHLARVTQDVQRTAMSMRMVPVGRLFRRMTRLVRDLALRHGKKIELDMEGEEVELDRAVVDALSDPIIHMLRNSIDHGLELPEQRVAAGKNPVGRVLLKAYHQSGYVIVEVSDDGRGLSQEKILAKAQSKGLVRADQVLNEREIFNLIFEPGFSTAEQVTETSGRGVGMDVVRRHVQSLRGRVDVSSKAGAGTTFVIKVPLTLAILDGLLIGVGNQRYIVPLFQVREMFRPETDSVHAVEQRAEMVLFRNALLPVLRLEKLFGMELGDSTGSEKVGIVIEGRDRNCCLMADHLLGKQEVVIKSLGEGVGNPPGIAGGAILGDGRVGLILDVDGLISSQGSAHLQ